jgi:hypothetical protein
LRDNFRREFKKIVKLRISDESAISGWMHFNDLKFLEQVLDFNKIHTQVMNCENGSNDFMINENDIETIVVEHSDVDDDNEGCEMDAIEKDGNFQQKAQSKHQCCMHAHAPNDEIIHFFKSITPYLAMMDPTMKLRVRIEIQEIILNEMLRNSSNKHMQELTIDKHIDKAKKKTEVIPKRVSKRIIKKNRKYI